MDTKVLVLAMNKRNDPQDTWFKIAKAKATTSEERTINSTSAKQVAIAAAQQQQEGHYHPQRQVFGRKDEPSVAVDNNDDEESGGMRPLGPNFTGPGPYDVVCARGSEARNHVGNRRFRDLIKSHIDRYSQAATKIEKSSIVSAVIDAIRRDSPGGGFVKEIDGKFFEVGDHAAREVSHLEFVLSSWSAWIRCPSHQCKTSCLLAENRPELPRLAPHKVQVQYQGQNGQTKAGHVVARIHHQR
jgi:hypothetical protein